MRSRPLARLVACAVVVVAGACIDITVSDSDLGSLRFAELPYKSIDAGDTLRDANDVAAPLQATAFRVDGAVDTEIPIAFASLSRTLTFHS